MVRSRRVLSFMSQWGGANRSPDTSAPPSPTVAATPKSDSPAPPPQSGTATPYTNGSDDRPSSTSPRPPRTDGETRHSRRSSMIMTYQPPMTEIAKDTPPELQPIFNHLNNHSNKLYQEGYFLKLHDLDSRGRPSHDRMWSECFAQLVGTVLSLWDAAALDAAGDDGEVMPTFVNLTDASIKMIESLPMNGVDGQALQNVLSISTAANNRYLLHFNSLHSLTQWTAGIRLAMFEQAALQEAYTGSIIAGKGKHLNSIRAIMERARFPTEDWARVRFGAGTPWRRCWCVITPPDEKEMVKANKLAKKRSAYEKSPTVRGDVKFFETRKVTKKTKPIATIKNAYAAYAIYPQSKDLIDQSTLVKLEGNITIHSNPETTMEGFVFAMPEVHPAITGFEIMIRWLLPAFDTFALYGRPIKLVADVADTRSLMFGMPSGRRYGYLDLIDVAGLIHTEGSENWSEREWRKQMKLLTSKRMAAPGADRRTMIADGTSRNASNSSVNLPSQNSSVRFGGGVVGGQSLPGSRHHSPSREEPPFAAPQRNVSDTALPQQAYRQQLLQPHQRASSDAYRPAHNSRLSFETARPNDSPPPPPPHKGVPPPPPQHGYVPYSNQFEQKNGELTPPDQEEQYSSDYTIPPMNPGVMEPLQPFAAPPTMSHRSNAQPPNKPIQRPDMLRANSAIDPATLAQMKSANPAAMQQNGGHFGPYNGTSASREEGQMHSGMYAPTSQQMTGLRRPNAPTGGPSPTSLMPDRRLPTIPGTPAFEQNEIQLAPPMQRERSSASIQRKPVPGRESAMFDGRLE